MDQVVDVRTLKPTQPCVGRAEVSDKIRQIEKRAGHSHRLARWKADHAVPVIICADGSMFLTDRHHSACALLSAPSVVDKTLPYRVVARVERADDGDVAKIAYLYRHGEPISFSDLPASLLDVADDPFRSVARMARSLGLFLKSDRFFAEFHWANYLRVKAPPAVTEEVSVLRSAKPKAATPTLKAFLRSVCQLEEARDLPGFIPTPASSATVAAEDTDSDRDPADSSCAGSPGAAASVTVEPPAGGQ